MPMPSARPDSEMMLRVMLLKYISTMANSTLRGILMATTAVGRTSLRNSASTMMASTAPHTRLDTTLLTMSLMYMPWSMMVVRRRFASSAISSAALALQASATAEVDAVEPLKMASTTAWLLFTLA